MHVALAVVVGYVIGTFPSAVLVTWLATRGRVDIRSVGSGNPGTLNALQSVGRVWGVLVLALDLGKGLLAGFLGMALGGPGIAGLVAVAVILGHVAPVWTRFRGGKGVATSIGACIAVFPGFVPPELVILALGALTLRDSTLAMQITGGTWVVASVLWTAFDWPNLWGPEPGAWLVAFSVAGAVLVLGAFARAARATRRALAS